MLFPLESSEHHVFRTMAKGDKAALYFDVLLSTMTELFYLYKTDFIAITSLSITSKLQISV